MVVDRPVSCCGDRPRREGGDGSAHGADLTGVDILRNATRNIYTETQDEKFAPPETLNRMVTAGDIGRKSGRGFYSYEQ